MTNLKKCDKIAERCLALLVQYSNKAVFNGRTDMKQKICLVMALAFLFLCAAALPVWGAQAAQDMSWAVLSYTYDPDYPAQEPPSGKLSVNNGETNYLHRCSTIVWDTQNAILSINGAVCEDDVAYLDKAGPYELTVTHVDTGEEISYEVELLPVVKAVFPLDDGTLEEQFFTFNTETKKFNSLTFLQYPTIVCTNANAKITVDDGVKDAETVVLSGDRIDRLGSHTLRFSSNGRAWFAPYCVSACTAQTIFDEASGKSSRSARAARNWQTF